MEKEKTEKKKKVYSLYLIQLIIMRMPKEKYIEFKNSVYNDGKFLGGNVTMEWINQVFQEAEEQRPELKM